MSKDIDLTKPLSEFDLRYLVDRMRWDDIRENARNLGLPEPTLPSARGLRAQVPRSQLHNTDDFNRIAEQLKVPVGEEDEPQSPRQDPVSERRAQVTAGDTRTPTGDDTDPAAGYKKMTVPQLQEELDRRREDYLAGDDPDEEAAQEVSYSSGDKKDDLIQKLLDDDRAVAEANQDDNQ